MDLHTFHDNWTSSIVASMEQSTASLDNVSVASAVSSSSHQWVSVSAYKSVMGFLTFVSMATGCLSVLCCLVNSLIYVRQLPNTSAYYLLALNIGDGVHSLCKMLFAVSQMTLGREHRVFFIMSLFVGSAVATVFRRTAVCMNALTSLDRFVVIAFPLRRRERSCCGLGGRHGPLWVILVVFAVVTLVHSYLFYKNQVSSVEDEDGGRRWGYEPTTQFMESPESFEAATQLGRALCFYLPLFLSLVFNLALLCALCAHDKNTRAMQSVDTKEREDRSVNRGEGHRQTTLPGVAGENPSSGRAGNGIENKDVVGVNSCKSTDPLSDKSAKAKVADRTRLILTLTFVFVFLALPRVFLATVPLAQRLRQLNLTYILVALGDCLTFCTDVVLFCVTLSHSQQFRRRVQRALFRLAGCRKGATASAAPVTSAVSVNTSISEMSSTLG